MNTVTVESKTAQPPIVSRDRWLERRKALLAREKAVMRLQDELAAERRALPAVRIDKRYVFETPQGPRTLAELFGAHSQLIVQHFMLAPGWEQGCPSCSYMADHNDGAIPHLAQRDIAFVAVSRAPLAEIERFRRRMGWKFDWVSSYESDFNRDFAVTFDADRPADAAVYYNYTMQLFPQAEAPGISVFRKDPAGDVLHTYSTYGRGVEVMMGAYPLMDLTPKGRDEADLPHTMAWVRHHDRYETAATQHGTSAGGACCAAHD